MSSHSILVGQLRSKSAMGLKRLMPERRRRRSKLRGERSAISGQLFEDLVRRPAGLGGAREKIVQLRG